MIKEEVLQFVENVLEHMPSDWLRLTTHRLDIYNEAKAKVQFLEEFEKLSSTNLDVALKQLPTSFDYIRLGHPLSCVLEWLISKYKNVNIENVITFSSQSMPILAILRKNLFEGVATQIVMSDSAPKFIDSEILKTVYGYEFDLVKLEDVNDNFNGTTVFITDIESFTNSSFSSRYDFIVAQDEDLGSIALVNNIKSEKYISEIQHVRRRESIAMTPHDSMNVLKSIVSKRTLKVEGEENYKGNLSQTKQTISKITNTAKDASLGSSGLSIQYAIMMGLVHHSIETNPLKKIKFIVPPNCYGGTNDQARRVAACLKNVEVLDLPVDSGNDMVKSVESILDEVASVDAIPFIIAEIPTNPRVEVPDLERLKLALSKKRKTSSNDDAISPVFILDQTFCPNVKFLGDSDYLSSVKTISYVSGSKFPSGGLCTAGYCVANKEAEELLNYVDRHLKLCGNTATKLQVEFLATQMPSMLKRIEDAYVNTREFVEHIKETLPEAKINFVSKELASEGFTPSVFSLDLPSNNEEHKRELNLALINLMITKLPNESKHCVSYGQLSGCYWTIPATSTQGTTKEGDKDYIVRVSMSPDLDLESHKKIFSEFCAKYI